MTSPVGLRERKRAATRQRIIHAAQVGSLEHGLEGVTIEGIARDADISPRSFFNYFSSREAAIVGLQPAAERTLTDDEMEQLPADIAAAVSCVVLDALGNQVADPEDELRREVFRRYPQLLDEYQSLWKASMQNATVSVARLLQRRGVAAQQCNAIAFTLVSMCVATIRTMLVAGTPVDADNPAGDVTVDAVTDAVRAVSAVLSSSS
ncbi:TetR/AcrR family transcriptional regulator [Curtobacterium sp. MCSS17_011]|uniref:TetR/AcrR family transcriptional regulator n=1 Tax=Curtobacterium sp. MCSS17_011 TaxID=2175643 RepID=UPI0015E879B3|nr:TetR/AcrR family transcriptional regulator [Curtobacterium sp. MCSS17_011]